MLHDQIFDRYWEDRQEERWRAQDEVWARQDEERRQRVEREEEMDRMRKSTMHGMAWRFRNGWLR